MSGHIIEVECDDCEKFCERPHCDAPDECDCPIEDPYAAEIIDRIGEIVSDQPYWGPPLPDAWGAIRDLLRDKQVIS